MRAQDAQNISFIIKIWIEESATESQPAFWRGHVTHVPSSARNYIQDLDQIAKIIAPYLVDMGVEVHNKPENR